MRVDLHIPDFTRNGGPPALRSRLGEVALQAEQAGLDRISVMDHQDRGVETPAFRPGRKRRCTSPEMSAVSDNVFVCPGTGSSPRPPTSGPARETLAGLPLLVWTVVTPVAKLTPAFLSGRTSQHGTGQA
jgi:hypothetical protein